MQQSLYFTPASGSLSSSVYISTGSYSDSYLSFYDVTLVTSASAYEASGSGGYSSTVGDIRIWVKSGSNILADFPIETTNIFYPPFPTQLTPSASTGFPGIGTYSLPSTSSVFEFSINNVNKSSFFPSELSGSAFVVYPSGSTTASISASLYTGQNILLSLDPSSSYYFYIFGSGSYTSSFTLYNKTFGFPQLYVTASNQTLTASFTPPTGSVQSDFLITATLESTRPFCCTPDFVDIKDNESNITLNYYLQPLCSGCLSVGLESTTGSIDGAWNFVTTQSCQSSSINLTYPNDITAYRFYTSCSGYTSSYSETIYFDPQLSIPQVNLTFSGSMPVSPTSSLSGWNTYLNITGSRIYNSASYVSILGSPLSSSLKLIVTSSNLTNIQYYGMSSIISQSFKSSKLTNFPATAYLTPSLSYYDISSNKITSSMWDISFNPNLQYFNCSGNYLTGSITELTGSKITYFNCSTNKLSGSTPDLGNNTYIQTFNCSSNKLSGSIGRLSGTTVSSSLKYFYCNSNALTSSIPNLNSCTNLQIFNCSNNKLSGSIPSLLRNLNLTQFICNDNYLTDTLPYMGLNSNLSVLYCQNNKLSGSITLPSYITDFNGENNYFTGSVPALGSTIQYFNCNINKMSGSIGSLVSASNLISFACKQNALTGSLPSLLNCANITSLYISDNKLTTYVSESGKISSTLLHLEMYNNLFTTASVNGILYDLVQAGGISGSIDISGTGNAKPSSVGLSYTASLKTKGWTIAVN